MSRTKSIQKLNQSDSNGSFELDLSPMLALMVCLIPIMLLATALVQLKVVETPLPQVVKEAIERDKVDKEKKPQVSLKMEEGQKIILTIVHESKNIYEAKISGVNGNWNKDELYEKVRDIKKQYPSIFHISISPNESASYEEIVSLIDVVRRLRPQDEKLSFSNEEGHPVQTDLLFPEVIFANVVEV